MPLRSLPIAKIHFLGKEGLPVWAITHFLERTCLNHMKLTMIQRICEIASHGFSDKMFSVVASSADIFPNKSFSDHNYEDVVYAGKEDAEEFWNIISRYKRPIVLFNDGVRSTPLYDFIHDDAATIWSFKEQSPPEGIIKGAAGALIELFSIYSQEERNRERHMNEAIGQWTANLNGIILVSQAIADPRTPPGIRAYAEQQLQTIMKQQQILNEKMGIESEIVDIKC